jgi:hypothetical protein
MLRFSLPMLAMLGACAATPEEIADNDAARAREKAELASALEGRTPGSPLTCLNTRNLNVDTYGDTLVYRGTGRGTVYVNQTNGGCFGLRRDDVIISQTPIGQFCRGDIIQTVDRVSGITSGSCAYGDFVPYVRQGG